MKLQRYIKILILVVIFLFNSLIKGEAKMKEEVYIIPGSHLDLFWMGTSNECLHKGAEILKEAIEICKDNHDFRFLVDSVVFVEYLVNNFPQYKDSLKKLIDSGQIEIAADYVDRLENQHGGESLIRQVVLGKRWLKENLGVDSVIAHHPDLPGITPQMPQIYKKCGVKYYLYGRGGFPDGLVYNWRSPDGSSIIACHYPRHYAYYSIEDVIENYSKIKEGFPLYLILAGLSGDLASPNTMGGYSEKLTEIIKRLNRDNNFLEFKLAIPSSIMRPYEDIPLPVKSGEIPSVWGTYGPATSVDIFILDKKAENDLLTLEKLLSLLKSLNLSIPEPQSLNEWKDLDGNPILKGNELSELWRMELFTQDHNYAGRGAIISESFKLETKKKVLNYTKEWIENCLKAIGENISSKEGIPIILFNPLSWERLEVVEIPIETFPEEFSIIDTQGNPLPYEKTKDSVRLEVSLPPVGYKIVYVKKGVSSKDLEKDIRLKKLEDTLSIENKFYELQISLESGEITRIFDREIHQELLEQGKHLGILKFYTEEGTDVAERSAPLEINWNAARREVTVSIEEGGLSSTVLIKRNLGLFKAQIKDRVTLYKDIKRIDIDTAVSWGGARSFQLRYVFPFRKDLSTINYGVPFYTVRYPETMEGIKGPWKPDEVLFEDWKHIREVANWIDLANDKFGLTLSSLSSSYYITPGELEAVLFRTINSCGDSNYYYNTEFGKKFEFKFSITSGSGDWRLREAYQKGLELLNPILDAICNQGIGSSGIPEELSLFKVQTNGIVVTGIQPNEKGILVRYYNADGQDKDVVLRFFDKKYKFAQETDLIGNPEGQILSIKDEFLSIKTRPYEIKTLLIME
jgi:alpha-mannosidase